MAWLLTPDEFAFPLPLGHALVGDKLMIVIDVAI